MKATILILSTATIPLKAFNRLCFRLFLMYFLFSPFYSFSQTELCDEVPVTMTVPHMGRTELPSMLCGEHVYYSVPGLFHFMEIKNSISDDFKVVQGFLKHQEDAFVIDEPALQIKYNNRVFALEPGDIIRTRTNLFLKSDYFETVFDFQNEYLARNLAATVVPGFELPAVKAAKRRQMRENLRKVRGEFLADTIVPRDHPLFHIGAAEWNVNSTQRTDGLYYNRLNIGLGGFLAGGEFTGSIGYNSNMDFSPQNLFYQWRHVNNQNSILRQVAVGKIASRSIASLFHPVVGVQITNAPTFLKKSFGTYALNDYTEPDWIVELYINNTLVDYTQADASGFFSFDVPLTYGNTEVSLRYYGPWGEEEVSLRNYSIPFNLMSPGELQYSLSSGMVEDGENSMFLQGIASYGLTDRITVGGGGEFLSSTENNPVIPFFNTSVRLPANMLVSGEYMHDVGFRGNFSYSSLSGLRLDLAYKNYEEEQDAVRYSYLEERSARLSIPLNLRNFKGTSRFNFQQNVLRNNSHTYLEWLLSGNAYGLRLNFTNTAFLNSYNNPLVYSRISTAIRLPKQIVFSPQVEYEYLEYGLTSFQGEVRKRFFKNINFQASFSHNFRYDQTYFNVGLNLDLGFTRLGMNSSINNRYASFSQTAGGSVLVKSGVNPWQFDHRPMIGRGGITFKPFLDSNGNGIRDSAEIPVEGVNVHLQGGAMRKSLPDGATVFSGLEAYMSYYFELDPRGLQNIAWQIDQESMEIFVNPNQVKVIEVPVKVVGEVAGFVYLGAEGIGGMRINIYDSSNKLVKSILSAPDGFFNYMGLRSGAYTAQLDGAQLERLKMRPSVPFDFVIDNRADGDYVDHIKFEVKSSAKKNFHPSE